MEKKLTYETDKECPVCFKTIKVMKTRLGIRMTGMDSDFRMRYEGVNPYLYMVWVCPHCGYAAQDTAFSSLGDRERNIIKEALQGKKIGLDLSGERTLDQAIVSYKLALHFGQIRKLPASQIAGLYLKMAWLCQDKADTAMEKLCLGKAVEHYMLAYSNEHFPIGKMTENSLSYLIANLLERTGQYEEAAKWLSRVITQRQAQGEAKIIDMARDLWQNLKEKRSDLAFS